MTEDPVQELLESIGLHRAFEKGTPHVVINANKVLQSQTVDGLVIEARGLADGVSAVLRVEKGRKSPARCISVSGCFRARRAADPPRRRYRRRGGCELPGPLHVPERRGRPASDDGEDPVRRSARYSYFERHWHSDEGRVRVVPEARIELDDGALFSTEFELLKGLVGEIDIDYEAVCGAGARPR